MIDRPSDCKRGVLLILICLIASAYTQELKISDFRPPSYKTFRVFLLANVDKYYYGDDIDFRLKGMPRFSSLNDTTELYFLGGIKGSRDGNFADLNLESYFTVRHYIFASPIFLRGKLIFRSSNYRLLEETPSEWHNLKHGHIEIGSGFGHLREGRFTALALHVNELLLKEDVIDENLSNKTIMELAKAISKLERFYMFKHERYEKYFYQKLEEIISTDPTYKKTIPVYIWFKIGEITNVVYYYYDFAYDYYYWLRRFGTRFSIDFHADEINESSGEYVGSYRKKKFPIFDSYYYEPSIRFRFEYENPIDLRKQLSINSSYSITWRDTVTYHALGTNFGLGYGIIDFILLEGQLSLRYGHNVFQDTTPEQHFTITPEAELSYYIEDFIEISLTGGCGYSIEKIEDCKYFLNPFFGLEIDWCIF